MRSREKEMLWNRNCGLWLMLILMLLSPAAFGGNTLILDNNIKQYALGRHLDYFEDQTNNRSIADMSSPIFSGKFQPCTSERPNFGHTASSIWVRTVLQNNSPDRSEWLLEVQAPRLNKAEIYLVDASGQVEFQNNGMSFPFSTRAIASRYINFKLKLAPGQQKTLFMRAEAYGSLQLPLVLWQPESFIKADHNEQLLMGFYYGAIIAILLINLTAFFMIRDITYIFYVAHLAIFGLLQFAMNGHMLEYVFPNRPEIVGRIVLVLIPLATSTALQFTRHFLDLAHHMPRANRLMHALSLLSLLNIAIGLHFDALAAKLSTAFVLAVTVTFLYVSFFGLYKGIKQVRHFLFAWTAFLVGVILFAMKNFDLLPSVFITDYGMQIGSIFEFFLLCYTLADRVRILKEENEKIHREALLTLENRVAERTLELVAQREVAERATRFKSEFLTNMSHEIRTPMNAIVGFTHLAMNTDLSVKQHNYLSGVAEAAKSLLGILDDVLDISKIEAGKLQLEQTDFDLDKVVENISRITSMQAQQTGVTLTFWIEPDVCRLLVGDALRLGQILLNLVNNAIKFSSEGEVHVSIAQSWRQGNELELKVCVSDTGIGISEEQAQRLFQSFNQADSSISRRYGGTGLGLAISKQLVEAMRGRIEVDSKLGEGSTFTFTTVFAAQDRGAPSDAPQPDKQTWAKAARRVGGAHVLVVEDQELNRQIVQEMLEAIGVVCHLANDGREAVRLALDPLRHYELVLMDLQMPEMSGLQACREIRRHLDRDRLPIVALTAHAYQTERQHCLDAGMNDYLTKPLDPYKLAQVLEQWIGHMPALEPVVEQKQANGTLPPALPGFDDLPVALARINHNAVLLRKLIGLFHDRFCGFAQAMRATLDAGARQEARRMMHALTGQAAALGASKLEAAAVLLQDAIANDAAEKPAEELAALLAAVDIELQQVLASAIRLREEERLANQQQLQIAAPDGLQAGCATDQDRLLADNAKADALIAELLELIRRNNVRAGKRFGELRQALRSSGVDGRLDEIGQALDRLDFEAARGGLDALAGDLRPPTSSTG